MNQRIAVVGEGAHALREALFLTTYTDQVTLLITGGEELPADLVRQGRRGGVRLVYGAEPADITVRGTSVAAGGREFDCIYMALGCETAEIVRTLPIAKDGAGAVIVDQHQQTSIPCLYAAGDIVRGLSQIAVAVGEAAIAATAIHGRLRGKGPDD